SMGSYIYAKRCKERNENIVAMISLETLGYYSDVEGSQKYPTGLGLFYSTTGNFVGFISNLDSRPLLQEAITAFRAEAKIPSEGAVLPGSI
ncbi:MAG: hypothetical protein MPJ24_11230, partial [Pirellulaceae bacterium]|nr:hypothetical protein [Pirellulaceae bacterium]